MDEVTINQIKYISSKRAAKASGYAKDYIGQLVRMGKLKATKVGRSWFVDESGLQELLSGKRDLPATINAANSPRSLSASTTLHSVASVSYPKTWSSIKYMQDDSALLPNSDNRDMLYLSHSEAGISRSSDYSDATSEPVKVHINKKAYNNSVSASSVDGIRVSIRDSAGTGAYTAVPTLSDGQTYTVRPQQTPLIRYQIVRILVSSALVAAVGLLIPILG